MGVVDFTPATTGIQANDTIFFDFDVTNVGNEPTTIVIPNAATISGSGTISGAIQYQQPGEISFTNISGSFTSRQIQPGASVRVRVPVLVGSVSSGISVTLGDTNPSAARNVAYLNTPGSVFTADNNTLAGENPPNTAPANGEREASNIRYCLIYR